MSKEYLCTLSVTASPRKELTEEQIAAITTLSLGRKENTEIVVITSIVFSCGLKPIGKLQVLIHHFRRGQGGLL